MLQWNGEAIAVDSICATEFQPVMAPNGVPCHRVERGGDVTYHGPGAWTMAPEHCLVVLKPYMNIH